MRKDCKHQTVLNDVHKSTLHTLFTNEQSSSESTTMPFGIKNPEQGDQNSKSQLFNHGKQISPLHALCKDEELSFVGTSVPLMTNISVQDEKLTEYQTFSPNGHQSYNKSYFPQTLKNDNDIPKYISATVPIWETTEMNFNKANSISNLNSSLQLSEIQSLQIEKFEFTMED